MEVKKSTVKTRKRHPYGIHHYNQVPQHVKIETIHSIDENEQQVGQQEHPITPWFFASK